MMALMPHRETRIDLVPLDFSLLKDPVREVCSFISQGPHVILAHNSPFHNSGFRSIAGIRTRGKWYAKRRQLNARQIPYHLHPCTDTLTSPQYHALKLEPAGTPSSWNYCIAHHRHKGGMVAFCELAFTQFLLATIWLISMRLETMGGNKTLFVLLWTHSY